MSAATLVQVVNEGVCWAMDNGLCSSRLHRWNDEPTFQVWTSERRGPLRILVSLEAIGVSVVWGVDAVESAP